MPRLEAILVHEDEYPDVAASIRGQMIVTNGRTRPQIVEAADENAEHYAAGIVPPHMGPFVSGTIEGILNSRYTVWGRRYDSIRLRASTLVEAEPERPTIPVDDDGNIDTDPPDTGDDDGDDDIPPEDPPRPWEYIPNAAEYDQETHVGLKDSERRIEIRQDWVYEWPNAPRSGMVSLYVTAIYLRIKGAPGETTIPGVYVKFGYNTTEMRTIEVSDSEFRSFRFALNSPTVFHFGMRTTPEQIIYPPTFTDIIRPPGTPTVIPARTEYITKQGVSIKICYASAPTTDTYFLVQASADATGGKLAEIANSTAEILDIYKNIAWTAGFGWSVSNPLGRVDQYNATTLRLAAIRGKKWQEVVSAGYNGATKIAVSPSLYLRLKWSLSGGATKEAYRGAYVTIRNTDPGDDFDVGALVGRIPTQSEASAHAVPDVTDTEFSIVDWEWRIPTSTRLPAEETEIEANVVLSSQPTKYYTSGSGFATANIDGIDKLAMYISTSRTRPAVAGTTRTENVPQGADSTSPGGTVDSSIIPPEPEEDTQSVFDFTTQNAGLRIGGLLRMCGDQGTDSYDSIQIVLYDILQGQYYVAATVPVGTISVSITSIDVASAEIAVPKQDYVFPACRVLKSFSIEGEERLVGAFQAGFNPHVDADRVFYFCPTSAGIGSDGVVTCRDSEGSAVNVSSYRDGTYLVVVHDANGKMLFRGYIGDDDPGSTDKLKVYDDFERTNLIPSDGDGTGLTTQQVWSVRRQVVAHVEKGTREVKLTYDVAGEYPVEVADQSWMHQRLVIEGNGEALIRKVGTWQGDYSGNLDNDKVMGSVVILEYAWPYATGNGLCLIQPESRTLYFGRGDENTWDTFGLGFDYKLPAKGRIVGMEWMRGYLGVWTEANEIFLLQLGPIGDPRDILSAAAFDIREAIPYELRRYNGSCVAPQSFFRFQDEFIGWIGGEGIWAYNFTEAKLLIEGSLREYWKDIDPSSLTNARACVDPQHAFGPVVRFAGITRRGETKRAVQLAFSLLTQTWLNFSDSVDIDAMVTATKTDGTQSVVFGCYGRLWEYGTPPDDYFGYPHVYGTRYGTCDALRDDSNNAIVNDEDAAFARTGNGYYYTNAGIRVAVVDEDGNWHLGTITTAYSSKRLTVTPDSTWPTNDDGKTWRYIIGPRLWAIELPWRVPDAGHTLTNIEAFSIDATDDGVFDWPIRATIDGSANASNVGKNTFISKKPFTRTDFQTQNQMRHFNTKSSKRTRIVLEGIHPPDGRMTIRFVKVRVRSTR